jgi:plasmid stabilization system protein ParE
MNRYEVVLTKSALADTDEAFVWLYDEEPEAAIRWYEELISAVRSLKTSPLRWGLAREDPFFDEEIRQLVYGRYRVLFYCKR